VAPLCRSRNGAIEAVADINRYTYVWNNPLAYTDPSGYTAQPKWLKGVKIALAVYITYYGGWEVAELMMSAKLYGSNFMAQAVFTAAATGGTVGAISSGSPKGALSGALTSLAFLGAGELATALDVGLAGRSAIHGIAGGVLDELQGGNFGHGFINAGVSKYLHTNLISGRNLGADIVVSALIGGTISEATGGNFANGAVTGAMQYAMNCMQDPECRARLEYADELRRADGRLILDIFGGAISQVINFFAAAQEGDVAAMVMEASPAGRAKRATRVLSAVDDARDLSKTTVGELRAAGRKDAHHVIQDAAARDLPGYNTNAAPGVQLSGPASTPGTPHYHATQIQRQAGGGTYAAERRIGYKALRAAGFSPGQARAEIQRADEYFSGIGVKPDTVTRVPGNR
jgi:hypothetical protein